MSHLPTGPEPRKAGADEWIYDGQSYSSKDSKDILIAVMGLTGTGKSTFIAQCYGDRFEGVGHELASYTQKISICSFKNNNTTVHLVDTPGFDDTYRSDSDVLREMAAFFSMLYQHGIRLTGIVYLHRISDARLGGSAMKNLRMFKHLCGVGCMPSVAFVTTMWNVVNHVTGLEREKHLMSGEAFWATMISQGAKVFRHDNSKGSAMQIVSYLSNLRRPIVLDIQREMVDENRPLSETSAGQEVDAELIRMRAHYEKKLRDIEIEMGDALSLRDLQLTTELKEIQNELNKKINQDEEARGRLKVDLQQLVKEGTKELEQQQRMEYELTRQLEEKRRVRQEEEEEHKWMRSIAGDHIYKERHEERLRREITGDRTIKPLPARRRKTKFTSDEHKEQLAQKTVGNPFDLRSSPTSLPEKETRVGSIGDAVFIAVMGATGAGKSNFIQKASGNMDIRIGHGLESETQRVQFIEFYHNQTQYVLIDTPGFNDTYRSDVDILKEISASLAITYRQNIKLVGVVFLQSILQPRMQGSAMRNLKMFDKLCGQGYLEKITLVSSFWDEVELDAGLHREAELTQTFWRDSLAGGSRIARFENTRESAIRILEELAHSRIVLTIQQEVVDQGYEVIDTAAGQFLNKELVELRLEYEEKIVRLQRQIQQVESDNNSGVGGLLDQRLELEAKSRTYQQQLDALRNDQNERFGRFEEEWAKNVRQLQVESEARQAENLALKQKLNDERAEARGKIEAESRRTEEVIKGIRLTMEAEKEEDRVWYEKRIQELEAGARSSTINQNAPLNMVVSTAGTLGLAAWKTTWTLRSSTLISDMVEGVLSWATRFVNGRAYADQENDPEDAHATVARVKGFVAQANRFFGSGAYDEGDETSSLAEPEETDAVARAAEDIHADTSSAITHLSTGARALVRILSCCECERFPAEMLYRAASQRRQWSSSGEIVLDNPRQTLVPTWLIDLFREESDLIPDEVQDARAEGNVDVIVFEGYQYYTISPASKSYEQNNLSTGEYLTTMFEIVSIVLCSFPVPYSEILWEETQWRFQEVLQTSCRHFLCVVNFDDVQSYLNAYPSAFKTSFLLLLLRFLLDDSFHQTVALPSLAFEIIRFVKEHSVDPQADLATPLTTMMLREQIVQALSTDIDPGKIVHFAKDNFCYDQRSTAVLGHTIDFLLRSTKFLSARAKLVRMAKSWTPYLEDRVSSMELVVSTLLLSMPFSQESILLPLRDVELGVRTATAFGLAQRQCHRSAKLLLEQCIEGVESIYSCSSHEFTVTVVELVTACNILRQELDGEEWARRALSHRLRTKESYTADILSLEIVLVDSLVGQSKYREAEVVLTGIMEQEAASDYVTVVSGLRLNKVRRRLGLRKSLQFDESSPLWTSITHLHNAEDPLKMECAEELSCTLSLLRQGESKREAIFGPRDVPFPKRLLENHLMNEVWQICLSQM